MKKVTPQMLKTNGAPMGTNIDQYYQYYYAKGHHTDNCHILKRNIEVLIQHSHL